MKVCLEVDNDFARRNLQEVGLSLKVVFVSGPKEADITITDSVILATQILESLACKCFVIVGYDKHVPSISWFSNFWPEKFLLLPFFGQGSVAHFLTK
jgi:hypothetical protein